MIEKVKSLAQTLGLIVVISFVFAWFGVYNTTTLPLLPRFGFWFTTMIVGFGASYFAFPYVRERLKLFSVYIKVPVLAAIISVPVTLVLMVIGSGRWSLQGLGLQSLYVLAVSLVLTSISWLIDELSARGGGWG